MQSGVCLKAYPKVLLKKKKRKGRRRIPSTDEESVHL